jgi:hypothetical protein
MARELFAAAGMVVEAFEEISTDDEFGRDKSASRKRVTAVLRPRAAA